MLITILTRGKYSINDNCLCYWIYNYYNYFPFCDSSLVLNLALRQGLEICGVELAILEILLFCGFSSTLAGVVLSCP